MQLNQEKIEILLGRKTNPPCPQTCKSLFSGKRVLVTGAGGSIGSELARLASPHCDRLILVERDEGRLYNIHREIGGEMALEDLYDEKEIWKIITRNKVDIVFHTAALKHVPILETFPDKAYEANVMATRRLARSAIRGGVESFIYISTDKAVEPKNAMGGTKRIAEDAIRRYSDPDVQQAIASEPPPWDEAGPMGNNSFQFTSSDRSLDRPVTFSIVRFGNVLGSSGSVLEIWDEQAKRGAALTLTYPSMSRFMMSLQEAAGLVVKAADIKESGTYIAEMGEPIDVYDLCKRFIVANNLMLPIKHVEHRPGEKMDERLHWDHERLIDTKYPHVKKAVAVDEGDDGI